MHHTNLRTHELLGKIIHWHAKGCQSGYKAIAKTPSNEINYVKSES